MGDRLAKYFDYAKEKGGLQVRMRLAMKSGISHEKAKAMPDDQPTLDKLHAVLVEILNDPNVPKY